MRTCIVMKEHYTGYQHSMRFVLNGPTHCFSVSQYTCDVIVAPCCRNSTISTPFLFQETGAISFLADVCLNFFGLFGECVCIHCFDCSLVSTFANETQVSSPVTCTMRLRNSSPSLWYCSKKSQSWSDSLHFVCTREHFQNPSCAKLVKAYIRYLK
jgi:hypothetical protein